MQARIVHRRIARPPTFLLLAVVALVLTGCDRASRAASGTSPRIEYASFHSAAVDGTLHYAVALPPGYATGGKRYPVVYFLHGLPAGARAYRNIAGLADSLARTGHRAIVVGAQGARPGDTDPEWLDWGPGRNWETATASELVSVIDHRYRTLATRDGRAIVGESAGGYGATLIGIHHPAEYSVIESWSGYFEPTNPAGEPEDLGSVSKDGTRARTRAWRSSRPSSRATRGRSSASTSATRIRIPDSSPTT